MGEIKARVDALVQKLGDLSADVRLEAIDELSTIDKEHALPALHWAIQNELDDNVRNAARDAYQRLARAPDPAPKAADGATVDKTRKIDRPRVKAVTIEEGAPNPAGRLSAYLGLAVAAALVVWLFIVSGQEAGREPVFFTWWLRIAGGLSVPGLAAGIFGVTRKGEKHIPAIFGIVINGLIVIIYFVYVILPLLKR